MSKDKKDPMSLQGQPGDEPKTEHESPSKVNVSREENAGPYPRSENLEKEVGRTDAPEGTGAEVPLTHYSGSSLSDPLTPGADPKGSPQRRAASQKVSEAQVVRDEVHDCFVRVLHVGHSPGQAVSMVKLDVRHRDDKGQEKREGSFEIPVMIWLHLVGTHPEVDEERSIKLS